MRGYGQFSQRWSQLFKLGYANKLDFMYCIAEYLVIEKFGGFDEESVIHLAKSSLCVIITLMVESIQSPNFFINFF